MDPGCILSPSDGTAVVRLDSGNGVPDGMDRRAIACFDQALADVALADDSALRQCCTTTSLGRPRRPCRYHRSADDVPDGLTIPRWSWDGL